MKLSDYENEEALDLLADIIDPAAEIMQDEEVAKLVRSDKPVIYAVKLVLQKHKKAAIQIVSALHRQPPEKYKFTVLSLASDLLDLMNDTELQAVFSSQSQMQEVNVSGSATESTGGQEK